MTTLTRLRLNPTVRTLARELADPVALHRRIMASYGQAKGPDARAKLGVLWRLDTDGTGQPVLLVQSHEPGDWRNLPAPWVAQVDSKEIDAALQALSPGQHLRFLLRANATRKINTKTGADGGRRNGQRVPLRSEESAIAWLQRHGTAAGFDVVEGAGGPAVTLRREPPNTGRRTSGAVVIEAVRFEGMLTTTSPDVLASTVRTGIGPAKAFGCGLLSLAPAG